MMRRPPRSSGAGALVPYATLCRYRTGWQERRVGPLVSRDLSRVENRATGVGIDHEAVPDPQVLQHGHSQAHREHSDQPPPGTCATATDGRDSDRKTTRLNSSP